MWFDHSSLYLCFSDKIQKEKFIKLLNVYLIKKFMCSDAIPHILLSSLRSRKPKELNPIDDKLKSCN